VTLQATPKSNKLATKFYNLLLQVGFVTVLATLFIAVPLAVFLWGAVHLGDRGKATLEDSAALEVILLASASLAAGLWRFLSLFAHETKEASSIAEGDEKAMTKKSTEMAGQLELCCVCVSAAATESDAASKLNEIPLKFMQGCFYDEIEGRRRWDITRKWRDEVGMDCILEEAPQPFFDLIKQHYPHFWCGRARNGSLIYVEKTGQINVRAMVAEGLTVPQLVKCELL
jgi:hypothetical protein